MSRTSTRVNIIFNNPYSSEHYDYSEENYSGAREETGEKARRRLDKIRQNVKTQLNTINWCDGFEITTAIAGFPVSLNEPTILEVELNGTSDISDETITSDVQAAVNQHVDAEVEEVLIVRQP